MGRGRDFRTSPFPDTSPSRWQTRPHWTNRTFRLLIAVSNPCNIQPAEAAIDVEAELTAFVEEFEKTQTPSRPEVTVLPGRTVISAGLAAQMHVLNWNVESGLQLPSANRRYCGSFALQWDSFSPLTAISNRGKVRGFCTLRLRKARLKKVVDDQLTGSLRCSGSLYFRPAVLRRPRLPTSCRSLVSPQRWCGLVCQPWSP